MNNRVIYQCFDSKETLLKFPYPPIYKEENTYYICFSLDKTINSKCWEMIYVENYDSGTIDTFLENFTDRKEVKTNQIQVGPIFNDGFTEYEPLITIPKLSDLPDIDFDSNKFVATCDENGNYVYRKNPTYSTGKYEGRELLLTIGVPVSNQIETIDRCLSHVKPLLDNLDAELVVVDTGSTDGTIEVCKEYGARIVEFPWCNNMSAARNVAINNAKGLWYMSIDDDEWFENVDDIIDFFKSGRFKGKQGATYIQRNYISVKNGTYTDTPALRLAKITPKLHFEGRIHDALVITDGLTIVGDALSSFAHHCGFARDDMEKIKKKYIRNISTLIYDVYEYPTNIRYNYQFANELHVIEHFKESAAYFFRGLAMELEQGITFYSNHQANALISTAYNQRSKDVFYLIDLLEGKYNFTVAERAYFAYIKAEMYLRDKRSYEKALENYKLYESYRHEFDKNPKESMANTYTGLEYCTNEDMISATHSIAFCAYMGLGLEEEALKELELLKKKLMFDSEHPIYKHIHMGSGDAFVRRMQDMTRVQCDDRIEFFLKGFVEYTVDSKSEKCELRKLATILDYFTIDKIQRFFFDNADCIEDDFWDKLNLSDLYALANGEYSISVQMRYLYAYMLKVKFVKTDKGMESLDMFLKYVRAMTEFSYAYYNRGLLEGNIDSVVPSEIRAVCLVWRGCNETSVQSMIKNLKEALAIYPEFYFEIGELLKTISGEN
ncbi:MAG: glycosyltransferase [Lachnospiraceae bacterium]|nr:glycosyltransferase [Lachnospiraceae bacterium]